MMFFASALCGRFFSSKEEDKMNASVAIQVLPNVQDEE